MGHGNSWVLSEICYKVKRTEAELRVKRALLQQECDRLYGLVPEPLRTILVENRALEQFPKLEEHFVRVSFGKGQPYPNEDAVIAACQGLRQTWEDCLVLRWDKHRAMDCYVLYLRPDVPAGAEI